MRGTKVTIVTNSMSKKSHMTETVRNRELLLQWCPESEVVATPHVVPPLPERQQGAISIYPAPEIFTLSHQVLGPRNPAIPLTP